MADIDLWADEALPESSGDTLTMAQPRQEVLPEELPVAAAVLSPQERELLKAKGSLVRVVGDSIELLVGRDLRSNRAFANDLGSLNRLEEVEEGGVFCYRCALAPVNAFVLRHMLAKLKCAVAPGAGPVLAEAANKIWKPTAKIASTGKHIELNLPAVRFYRDLVKKVGGYPVTNGYRVAISRVLDLEALVENAVTCLPKIEFDTAVLQLNRQPLPAFDGTLDSLKSISVGALNVIATNAQTWKAMEKSKKSLEEKVKEFGIESLYDLLFTLPRRFIDKTNPQEIEGLMEGESVTIVGKVASVTELPNRSGLIFTITNSRDSSIRCTFWRQMWLQAKYKVGDEVLLTGKVAWFNRTIQLNGSSIEHAEEAAVLPIVPIYKQSESKGVTTNLIMAANRELLARAGKIELPEYFRQANRMEYTEAMSQLHFPTSLEAFKRACDDLAYYELVYMQLIMQEERAKVGNKKGVRMAGGPTKLQAKAAQALPFKLTNSQVEGVKKLNSLLAAETPSQTLLNADVGAGKSLVAQLGTLKAVEAGFQAVLLGPTEILARQLYTTLEKLIAPLVDAGEDISIAFLGAGMKVKEKKPILAGLKDGSIHVVVGTTSVIADSVEYANLGLVVIDEQQKFGAEQRTRLLSKRGDGLVPDLLMMSATPIPRSTAQVFYGDMEMIELTEKPPGRLPIVTEWIVDDPIEFSRVTSNEVWSDLRTEALAGNQSFVITPMVQDSDKVDAASVERTFKNLSDVTLTGVRVGYVHGRMKKDEQQEVMRSFRAKELDVLVASTVVEVGVDIPDATRVVILSADRLGASSLHQIRGRVGRNSKQSKCYLVSLGKTENSQIRLQALVDSENGFDIALADLDVRGEGTMFSTEQSGSSEMIFASLAKHKDWIADAKAEAEAIIASPFRDIALSDARARFEAAERLF